MTHWLLTYKPNLQQTNLQDEKLHTEQFTVEMIENKDYLPADGGQRKLSVSAQRHRQLESTSSLQTRTRTQAVMELIKPFWSIYKMIEMVKTNDQQFPHVLQRLKALENLVFFILQKEPEELSYDMNEAFGKFNEVLLKAEELIKEFSDRMKVVQIVKSSDYKQEIDNLNKSLTDAFVALSGALHVQEEKELQRQKIRLANQEKKMVEQERKLTGQERELAEQEEKLTEQERKLAEQEEKLVGQERKLAEQERKLARQERKQAEQEKELAKHEEKLDGQERKLAEQREKLAEQEDMLQKLESKLSYRFNCTVQ